MFANFGSFLNLNKCSYLGVIADLAAIEIYEVKNLNFFT